MYVAKLSQIAVEGIHYEESFKYPQHESGSELPVRFLYPIKVAVKKVNSPLIKKLRVIDLYSGEDGNTITMRLTFSCMDWTLTREEDQDVTASIVEKLACKMIYLKYRPCKLARLRLV